MSMVDIKAKKVRLSYFISENILSDIKSDMNQRNYDLKSKSKWISEAIEAFFELRNFIELVMINDQMHGFEKLDSISIERSLKTRLDLSVIDVRKTYPALEGVQSKIVRAAIIQRLLGVTMPLYEPLDEILEPTS